MPKNRGMYTKHYADYQDERIWLDWNDFPGLDRETRFIPTLWQPVTGFSYR